MNHRSAFISAQAFDGMLAMLVGIGLVLGFVIFGLPAYFYGYQRGVSEARAQAMRNGSLRITYDQKDGHVIETWMTKP